MSMHTACLILAHPSSDSERLNWVPILIWVAILVRPHVQR